MTQPIAHQNHTWVKAVVFDHLKPASELAEYLNAHGFVARVYDERKLQRYWFLAKPRAGISVQVEEGKLESVRQFLAGNPAGDALTKQAIRCPSCNSMSIHYPQMTRKNVLPTIVAHALVALHLMEHQCYCEDCHYAWVRGARAGKSRLPLLSSQK